MQSHTLWSNSGGEIGPSRGRVSKVPHGEGVGWGASVQREDEGRTWSRVKAWDVRERRQDAEHPVRGSSSGWEEVWQDGDPEELVPRSSPVFCAF